MQINIDKKTGIFVGIIVLLLAIIINMGMSRNDNRGFFGMHSFGMMDSNQTQGSLNLTGADVMFLQMMIPHHQQAVDISKLAIEKSKDVELIALATQIRKDQQAEIIQMESWLGDADSGHGMGHSMEGSMEGSMGGMLTKKELSALETATGKSFDLLWLQAMTDHHDGALHMVRMIRDARNAEIKRFGENVVIAQSAQIEQMKLMIERLQ